MLMGFEFFSLSNKRGTNSSAVMSVRGMSCKEGLMTQVSHGVSAAFTCGRGRWRRWLFHFFQKRKEFFCESNLFVLQQNVAWPTTPLIWFHLFDSGR
jgi:hypothetical protein